MNNNLTDKQAYSPTSQEKTLSGMKRKFTNRLFHFMDDSFYEQILDEKFRYFYQLKLLCAILGSVSLFMGIMNLFTHKHVLMIATIGFSIICYINFLILHIFNDTKLICYIIFDFSVICLFAYFLITGGTAGFSPHWILLMPTVE